MKTSLKTHRGGVTLGLLAVFLIPLGGRLAAQSCQDGAGPGGDAKGGRWMKRFDVNQDGKLDAQETAAMEAAKKESFQRMQGKWDKDGDGTLSESEKADRRAAMEAKRQEMVARFDKDGDGRLNPEEKKAARDAMKAEHGGGKPGATPKPAAGPKPQ